MPEVSGCLPGGGAVAVIAFAVWARQTDFLGWQSGTNIVLAVVLLVLAPLRWLIGVAPLVSFWIILPVGITIAIAAMWSMLYRPETAQPRAAGNTPWQAAVRT